MKFKEGDLVRGSRPWNKYAYYGIVIETRPAKEDEAVQVSDSFRVHWVNPGGEVKQFTTWEENSSLWKWLDE